MKKFIKKNWAVIGFVLAFILDANYGILERFIKDPFYLNIAKGLGALLLAHFKGKDFVNSISARNKKGAISPGEGM